RKRINNLQELAAGARARVDAAAISWTGGLGAIDELLGEGIRNNDRHLVAKAVRDLDSVLRLRPPLINSRLFNAAKDLPLESVVKSLRVAQDRAINQGADALDILRRRLDTLVDEH